MPDAFAGTGFERATEHLAATHDVTPRHLLAAIPADGGDTTVLTDADDRDGAQASGRWVRAGRVCNLEGCR